MKYRLCCDDVKVIIILIITTKHCSATSSSLGHHPATSFLQHAAQEQIDNVRDTILESVGLPTIALHSRSLPVVPQPLQLVL